MEQSSLATPHPPFPSRIMKVVNASCCGGMANASHLLYHSPSFTPSPEYDDSTSQTIPSTSLAHTNLQDSQQWKPPHWLSLLYESLSKVQLDPSNHKDSTSLVSKSSSPNLALDPPLRLKDVKHSLAFSTSVTLEKNKQLFANTTCTMARRGSLPSASRIPSMALHMNFRRRRVQQTSSSSISTSPPGDSATDESPSISSPPSSPPQHTQETRQQFPPVEESQSFGQKRKISFEDPEEKCRQTVPSPPRKPAKRAKKSAVDKGDDSDNEFAQIRNWNCAQRSVTPPLHERLVPEKRVYYGADGYTRYSGRSRQATPAPSSPKVVSRGGRGGRGGRSRVRAGRQTNGLGRSKLKPEERDRDDESPDPTPKKAVATGDERAYIARLKARQQELKSFFHAVGRHEIDALSLLATRDLAKLVRKAKAHKKVPEYEQVMQDLEDRRHEATKLALTRAGIEVGHANNLHAISRDAVIRQYREHIDNVQREHLKGAEGEILLLKQAYCAANDDTRTETASEIESPTYHPHLPPGRIRGYNSNRITDETAFRARNTNFSDQVLHEVIDSDVISPIEKDLKENAARLKEEKAKKRTMNLDTLSEEAIRELEKMKGYFLPRKMHSRDMNSFGLSVLADAAEYMAHRYPKQQYTYHPLPPNTHYPAHGLNFAPLPGSGQIRPSVLVPPPLPHPPPLPNPPQPAPQEFVFQPQQQFFPRRPPPPQRALPVQTHRLPHSTPVTFINQTIPPKKAGAKGAQRMLLPKV